MLWELQISRFPASHNRSVVWNKKNIEFVNFMYLIVYQYLQDKNHNTYKIKNSHTESPKSPTKSTALQKNRFNGYINCCF